jgi:hypothetical protein
MVAASLRSLSGWWGMLLTRQRIRSDLFRLDLGAQPSYKTD